MTALTFDTSKRGYANMWRTATLRDDKRTAAQAVARRLNSNQTRYAKAALGRMPWFFPAIIHNLEAGGDFTKHLHNGDPLTGRTYHVPAGRPVNGSPPFTWEDSARDALTMKGLDKVGEWDVPRCLFEWERYNGFGYVARKVNSPYVWSFTNQYSRGKYVADGKFDALAVSQQCGAAATLEALVELKLVTLPAPALSEDQKGMMAIDRPVSPIVRSPTRTPQWDIVGAIIGFIKRIFS